MRDWTEIDRMLDQLGPAPADVGALIARVLGPDRSPQALLAALQALGAEPPSELPPAPAPRREPSSRPLSSLDTIQGWPPESEPPASEDDGPELSLGAASDAPPADEAPLSTRALLDRELDPSEFPSRPPQRVETPPPPASAAQAEEDDFELLIEDEEILEIQEDDVETDESDEP